MNQEVKLWCPVRHCPSYWFHARSCKTFKKKLTVPCLLLLPLLISLTSRSRLRTDHPHTGMPHYIHHFHDNPASLTLGIPSIQGNGALSEDVEAFFSPAIQSHLRSASPPKVIYIRCTRIISRISAVISSLMITTHHTDRRELATSNYEGGNRKPLIKISRSANVIQAGARNSLYWNSVQHIHQML